MIYYKLVQFFQLKNSPPAARSLGNEEKYSVKTASTLFGGNGLYGGDLQEVLISASMRRLFSVYDDIENWMKWLWGREENSSLSPRRNV